MPNHLSPVGVFIWGSLIEPKENQASGEMEWSCGLVVREDECQDFFAVIEEALAAQRAQDPLFPKSNEALNLPFAPSMKKNDQGELEPHEGHVVLKFKRKRMIKRRGSKEKTVNTPPAIYDSTGQLVIVPEIRRGSRGKAVFDVYAYNMPKSKGIGLGLRGFQIVELAEKENQLPPVEGGWKAESELDQLLTADA